MKNAVQNSARNLAREYVRCGLCGGDNTRVKYRIDAAALKFSTVWVSDSAYRVHETQTVVMCQNCGLVYVNPRLTRVVGIRTYSEEDEMAYFNRTRDARRMAFRDMASRWPKWLGRHVHSLLDVGCGDGVLIEVARSRGIETLGTEISEPLVNLVRKRLGEHAIISGDLENLPRHHFDVVTLINVLEHVPDPNALLKTCAGLLKTDGVLVAHTINLGGLPARVLGSRWYHVEPLNHLYYFTERTLRKLMLEAGLDPFERFSLVISRGIKGIVQRLLGRGGLYLDNGLGLVARLSHG